jgi:histidinol-phosphatase (PHP family)
MLFNYHTHTARCHHARGTEREYIEAAIKKGIKVLGFSDHAPFKFPNGFVSGCRMTFDELREYFDTVRSLAKEYEGKIRILCGLEMEYSPSLFESQTELLSSHRPDYLILGQHYVGEEWEGKIAGMQRDDVMLKEYVDQVLTALETGAFLYLAHPDMAGYKYSDAAIKKEYFRLCEGAKEMNIPLEINLLGVREKRHYPDMRFFEIASKVGNKVLLGSDAHAPDQFLHPTDENEALEIVETLGLELIREPII